MARPRRLPGSPEVRVGCPPLGRAERTFWVRLRPYGWISSFFTAVFCSTQLASSIAVPGVPLDPQEELMVTRDHRSVPFWDFLSQPAKDLPIRGCPTPGIFSPKHSTRSWLLCASLAVAKLLSQQSLHPIHVTMLGA